MFARRKKKKEWRKSSGLDSGGRAVARESSSPGEQARRDGSGHLTDMKATGEVMFGPEMNPLTKIHQPSFTPDAISRGKSTLRDTARRLPLL